MEKEAKSLSPKAFEEAATFLRSQARPLEASRFNNIFNGSDVADVLIELKKFQNTDGGFGHALEPDLRAPESSALCSSIAFQIIRDHHIYRGDDIVQQGIRYFADTLDQSELHWRIISETADAAPHAPWWNQEGREAEFRGFSLNPTAEILGYLLDYGESVIDERIILQLVERIVGSLRSLKEIEMHDLLCCLRLLDSQNLPPSVYQSVLQELRRLISGAVSTSPEQWTEYCLKPLQVIARPDSPFMDGFEKSISLNLEFDIKEQKSDGSWSPTWSWGNQYPESWEEANREWSGCLTFEKLLLLKRFDYLESKHNNATHDSQYRSRE